MLAPGQTPGPPHSPATTAGHAAPFQGFVFSVRIEMKAISSKRTLLWMTISGCGAASGRPVWNVERSR
jgi:hypothetical protein